MESSDNLSRSSRSDSYDSESDSYSDSYSDDRAPVKSSVAELQIKHLESEISDYPSSALIWNKKIELINLYRKSGNLVEARKIRTTLADSYPLSEKLWLEWLEDEQPKAETDDEQDYISSLYKKAVEDYISVDIWVKRVDWEYTVVLERNATPNSVDFDKIRSLYESAIVSCGLHFTQGHKLWKAFVNFEKALLAEVNNTDEKTYSAHIGKIRNLYKRQCALPFKHLEDITTEYQNWEASLGDNKQACQLSNAAVNLAKEKFAFEDKISDTFDGVNDVDYSQLDDWKKYLQAEEEKNESIPRIKCLYERALRNYFLDYDIWKNYLSFLVKVQNSNLKLVFPQFERALRNCPHPDFWVTYMLTLEKLESDITEVYNIFQRSYSSGSGVIAEDDFILVFEAYLDIKLRYIKVMALTQDSCPLIEEYRQLCEWCITSMPHFPILCARIKQHWAHVEVYIFRENVDKVVELFDDLLAKNPKDSELWQDAINCLLFFNDLEKCRNFYKRAVNSVLASEPLQVLFNLWIAFERINGTAETLALCKERLQKWQEIEAEKRRQEEAARLKEEAASKILQKKRKLSASESKDHFQRNFKNAKLDTETSAAKDNEKQEFKTPLPIKRETAQQPNAQVQPAVNVKTEEKQPVKLETVVEKESDEVKEESNGMDVEKPAEAPKKRFDDKMTVFFNNVPYKADEEEIKEFLGSGGAPVKEVRLAVDKFTGKFKGFGYADFENAEDRQKCIDGCNGKKYPNSQAKIKVEISNPPTKPAAKPVNPYLAHTERPRGGRSFNSNNRAPYINKNNNSHSSHKG
jgi:RNA recognition motif-containing protein